MGLVNPAENNNPEFKYTRETEKELLDLIFFELKKKYKGTPSSVGLLFSDLKVIDHSGGTTEDLKSRIEAIIVNSGLVNIIEGTKVASVQFKLSSTGLILLEEHGSYSNYMLTKLKKQERQEIIERLEFDNLQNSVYKLQKDIDDYPDIRLRTVRSERATIGSVVLAAIALLCQLLCNKSG